MKKSVGILEYTYSCHVELNNSSILWIYFIAVVLTSAEINTCYKQELNERRSILKYYGSFLFIYFPMHKKMTICLYKKVYAGKILKCFIYLLF